MSEKRKRSMDGVRKVKKTNSLPLIPTAQGISSSISQDRPIVQKRTGSKRKKSSYSTSLTQRSFLEIIKANWFWLNYIVKIFAVLVLVIFIANRNTRTTVHVTSHIEYLELDDQITAYTNPQEGELGFDIIAVTDEVSTPIDAAGTRPVEESAKGTITIYNNYSSEPQRLLPETRFESAGGKIFKLGGEEVIVPGKNAEAPGTIDVEVTADKPGPEYNIDITDFSIPGFKDLGLDEKYEGIYAVSTQKFSGGIVSTEGYIQESQRTEAEQTLKEQLSERLKLRLLKENTDTVLVVGNSAEIRFKESEFISDDNEQQGLLTQKGTIVALALSKDALDTYSLENYLILAEGEEAQVIDNQSVQVVLEESTVDYNNLRSTRLVIKGKVLLQWEISPGQLTQKLQGVDKEDLSVLLREINSIDTAKIDIFPPWKKNVSHSADEIEIQVD